MAAELSILLPAALLLAAVLSVPVLACDLLLQQQCRVFAAAFKNGHDCGRGLGRGCGHESGQDHGSLQPQGAAAAATALNLPSASAASDQAAGTAAKKAAEETAAAVGTGQVTAAVTGSDKDQDKVTAAASAPFFLRLLFAADVERRGQYAASLLCRYLICLLFCFPPVVLILSLSGDPIASLVLSAVPFVVFFIISLIKFKVLHEPLVFSDLLLLKEIVDCPRFYLGYVTLKQWVGVAVLFLAAVGLLTAYELHLSQAAIFAEQAAAGGGEPGAAEGAVWGFLGLLGEGRSGYEPSLTVVLLIALCMIMPPLIAAGLARASGGLRAWLTYCSSVLFEPDACRGAAGAGTLIYFMQGLLLFWLRAVWPAVIAGHNARGQEAAAALSAVAAEDAAAGGVDAAAETAEAGAESKAGAEAKSGAVPAPARQARQQAEPSPGEAASEKAVDKIGFNSLSRDKIYSAESNKKAPAGSIVLLQAESLINFDNLGTQLSFTADAELRAELELYYFGAYTMRTEFSVLTGIDPRRLGAYAFDPYQLAGRMPMGSLASLLKEAGFYCICLHANSGRFFNRRVVMRNLGFDETIFAEDLALLNTAGFKDTVVYQTACQRLQKAAALGQKLFVFIISLDGHGPYTGKIQPGEDREHSIHSVKDRCGMAVSARPELAVYRQKQQSLEQGVQLLRESMSSADSLFIYGDHLPPISSLLQDGRIYRAAASVPKPAVYAFNLGIHIQLPAGAFHPADSASSVCSACSAGDHGGQDGKIIGTAATNANADAKDISKATANAGGESVGSSGNAGSAGWRLTCPQLHQLLLRRGGIDA